MTVRNAGVGDAHRSLNRFLQTADRGFVVMMKRSTSLSADKPMRRDVSLAREDHSVMDCMKHHEILHETATWRGMRSRC